MGPGFEPVAINNQLLPLLCLRRFSEFESLQKISGPLAIYGKFHFLNRKLSLGSMAIRVVEFSNGGYKIRKIFA